MTGNDGPRKARYESMNLVFPISQIMRLRKYGMSTCVKLKPSSPLDRCSRNWHVKTPQSKPFSCCGVS